MMEGAEQASEAARRQVGEGGSFLIPADQVHPRLLERLDSGAEPAIPRPASTIVLVREGADGPEVLLLQRPLTSSFAPGAWVFPGGAVDDDDGDAHVHAGPGVDWQGRLGVPRREAMGFVVAGLREAWEETGILLARPSPDPAAADRLRVELIDGRIGAPAALRQLSTRFAADDVIYLAHWITPEPELRRFDTRFFLAPTREAAACRLIGGELSGCSWNRPSDAVGLYHHGQMRLLPPTVHTLDRLSQFRSVSEMVHALRDEPVAPILPRMRRVPEGVLIDIMASGTR